MIPGTIPKQSSKTSEPYLIAKIAEITLPIFVIALIGFFYSRAAKPDFSSANKLVVDIALPILIFTSLAAKDFNPQTAALFTGYARSAMLPVRAVFGLSYN
jgi:predicted permease